MAFPVPPESAVAVTAASATSISTRYKGLASADSGLFGDGRLETLASDYSVAFTVSTTNRRTVTSSP